MIDENETEEEIIITPHHYLRITGVLLGMMLVFIGTLVLISFSNLISILLGVAFYILGIYIASIVLFSKVGYDQEYLMHRGIFATTKVKISDIQEIQQIKVFGTVGNVPISFSKINFLLFDNTERTFGLRLFAYEEILPIIQTIQILVQD